MQGKVLIVDDDAPTREILSRYLTIAGYECHAAESFDTAVQMLAADEFHVVVTDKNMPALQGDEENGLALVRHIRQSHPSIGTVVITGFATIESAVEAMRLGAFDYVAKPFDLEALRGKVDRIREYQTALNPESIMNTYRHLHDQMLELYEHGEQTSEEKKRLFLELIKEKMDLIFDRFREFERLLLYQRERLAEIAFIAGRIAERIPETDPFYPAISHIVDEANRRM